MKEWRKVKISPSASILEAMRLIDESAYQIALVADEYDRLLGTVTDGDIRRGILRGIELSEPVQTIMNPTPIYITKSDSHHKILSLFQQKGLRQLPIVGDDRIILGIELAEDYAVQKRNDNWVVLMAGGLGTRLYPLTTNVPKPMLAVGEKPILETILESFIEHGFHQFYLSVNFKKEIIKSYFSDGSKWGVTIRYLDESQRLGTAGALSMLPVTIHKPIIVMNGDILTKVNFQHLIDFHIETNTMATMCVREYHHQVPYGVVRTVGDRLLTIEEKPTHKYFVNAGIYVLNPEALRFVPQNDFFDMPTLFEKLIHLNYTTSAFPIREYWLDIGRMSDFERANTDYEEVFR